MFVNKRYLYCGIVAGTSLILLLMLLSAAAFASYGYVSQGISFFTLFQAVGEISYIVDAPAAGMEGLTGLMSIIFLVVMIIYIALAIIAMFVKNNVLDKIIRRSAIDLGVCSILLGVIAIIYAALTASALAGTGTTEGVTMFSLGGIFYLILGVALIVLYVVFRNKIKEALE